MVDKLIYIPNDDIQNYHFYRLQLVVNEPTNQNSLKVPKVVESTNKETLLQNFGDWCNKQPNVSN